MAESIALAVLENLVHVSRHDFPNGYVCVTATIPDGMAVMLESALRRRPELRELSSHEFGDRWIDSGESAVLRVSSAVVTGEHNYLLNPAHPDFVRLGVEPPAMFQFDARLFGGGGR